MANKTGISLLGFAGYEASERFLRALDDEIWVARDPVKIPVHRPEDISTGDAMRAELERTSPVTLISAHAGYPEGRLAFCGAGDDPVLHLDSIRTLGATSMLIIDTCYAPAIAAELKNRARHGSLIVGLSCEPGEEQITWGRDSITAVASIIRELCYSYPYRQELGSWAAARAVDLANTQIQARNDAERRRGVTSKTALRPLLDILQC
jgi:hypothetical protein